MMQSSFSRTGRLVLIGLLAPSLLASSHREAPLITSTPKVDGADFYAFRSYEPGSEPKDDLANFADYVTHPTLPALIEILYGAAGAVAPKVFPRADLVAAFVTGVDGLNKNGGVGEMLRLNMDIPPTPRDQQKNMGVISGFTKGVLNAAEADFDAGFLQVKSDRPVKLEALPPTAFETKTRIE